MFGLFGRRQKTVTTPKLLHKYYRANEYSLEALRSNKLWMAKPHTLNDPFDLKFSVLLNDPSEMTEQHLRAILEMPVDMPEFEKIEVEENGEKKTEWVYHTNETTLGKMPPEMLADIFATPEFWKFPNVVSGISCFSEHSASPLMWAHYAEQNKGFVVSYRVPQAHQRDGIFYLRKLRFGRVEYTDQYPEVTVLDFLEDQGKIFDKLSLTKGLHWSYEREWRVLSQFGDQLVDCPFDIVAVYFGYNMEFNYKRAVFNVCTEHGIDSYQQIPHPTHFTYLAVGPMTSEDLHQQSIANLVRSLELEATIKRFTSRKKKFSRVMNMLGKRGPGIQGYLNQEDQDTISSMGQNNQ